MTEYERLSLQLMWLMAQGQLLSISQNENNPLAASVNSHQQALTKIKTEIETLYQRSALEEIERTRAEAEAAKRRCEQLVQKYPIEQTPPQTQTFTT